MLHHVLHENEVRVPFVLGNISFENPAQIPCSYRTYLTSHGASSWSYLQLSAYVTVTLITKGTTRLSNNY